MTPKKKAIKRRIPRRAAVKLPPKHASALTNKPFSLPAHIQRYVNLSKSTIFEVGIGQGPVGAILGTHVKEYRGVDPNIHEVKIAREKAKGIANIHYVVGRGEQAPFRGKCQVIICSFSWHYLNHPRAIREFSRVLSRNGIIVIIEPSQRTTNWLSPVLIKGSDSFSKTEYDKKMAQINRAQIFLQKQKIFKIVEEFYLSTGAHIQILKKIIHPS